MFTCDILVVGAGPAGSSAALEASKAGARVLIVDRKRTIGQPVQCGEMIPNNLLGNTEIVPGSIIQEIKTARTFLPNGEWAEHASNTYMMDRAVFDKGLALLAVKEGARLLIRTQCISKEGEKVILKRGVEEIEVAPKVIIGADGPKSTVGSWIGSVNKEFYTTLQYEVPLITPSECSEFYFDDDFFGGYAWLFPKGKTANVGLAVKYGQKTHSKNLHELLKKVVEQLCSDNKIEDNPVSVTGGLIPVGGPVNTRKDNILLAGDAAGQTHPISGGGIGQAFACGKFAGDAAARAIREDDLRILDTYELKWQYVLLKELKRACAKRQILESRWDELDSIVKRCWIMFDEYYKED
jgi:geranylgeranyl reductase family protein